MQKTDTSFTVEQRIVLPWASIEVRNYAWREPLDEIFYFDKAALSCSLTTVPKASQGRPDISDRHFCQLGQIIFRPKGVPFHVRNAGGRQRLLYCALDDTGLPEELGNLPGDQHLATRAALDIRDRRISAALIRLSQEAKQPAFGSTTLSESLLLTGLVDLWRYLLQREESDSRRAPRLAPWQLRRVMDRLGDETQPPPLVTDLALLTGISRRHLSRAFKNTTGRTVSSIVAEAQIGRARRLLEGEQPIKEIAFSLGFSDHSSFCTAFRQATGRSPSDYRREALALCMPVRLPQVQGRSARNRMQSA